MTMWSLLITLTIAGVVTVGVSALGVTNPTRYMVFAASWFLLLWLDAIIRRRAWKRELAESRQRTENERKEHRRLRVSLEEKLDKMVKRVQELKILRNSLANKLRQAGFSPDENDTALIGALKTLVERDETHRENLERQRRMLADFRERSKMLTKQQEVPPDDQPPPPDDPTDTIDPTDTPEAGLTE